MNDQQFIESLDEKAQKALDLWHVPSFGLGIIKDGKVVYCGGAGLRNVEKGLKADGQTLYQIGSCSKAFTAAVCAKLVDEGKLDWDKPVRFYDDSIKFYDDFTSKDCTLRDLLSHRTGLPRHEYSWYGTDFNRQQMVENMKYFEPSQPIRTTFQYCNYGFVMAGHLCEKVTGKCWEELLDEYIFQPLGMTRSNAYIDLIEKDENHATPYDRKKEGDKESVKEIPFYRSPVEDLSKKIGAPFGPAGSINSCAEDMLKWVQFHLNNGKAGDEQVISEASMNEMHKPQMLRTNPLDMPNEFTEFMSYGLGWFTEMYRGHKFVHHGGNINGFSAFTSFVPDLNLGVVCYTNMNSNFVHYGMARDIIDHYLGVENEKDWVTRYHDFVLERAKSSAEAIKFFTGEKVEGTIPSHPLEAYTGTYRRDGYSDMVITLVNGKLKMDFISGTNTLEHFHYDTFVTGDVVGELPTGFPCNFFRGDKGGDIQYLTMPLVTEPGGAIVRFEKVK